MTSKVAVFSIETLGTLPQSIRGQSLARRLPSVPPSRDRTSPFGLHRYKPVRARISLARQGISLESFCDSGAITCPFGPACRHADRTISSSRDRDVRRMASEDSDQFLPWFLMVHRLPTNDSPATRFDSRLG